MQIKAKKRLQAASFRLEYYATAREYITNLDCYSFEEFIDSDDFLNYVAVDIAGVVFYFITTDRDAPKLRNIWKLGKQPISIEDIYFDEKACDTFVNMDLLGIYTGWNKPFYIDDENISEWFVSYKPYSLCKQLPATCQGMLNNARSEVLSPSIGELVLEDLKYDGIKW